MSARLAIVVQQMFDSQVSGVIFTTDPVSGRDVIVIEAGYGLGEGVVSGIIDVDRYYGQGRQFSGERIMSATRRSWSNSIPPAREHRSYWLKAICVISRAWHKRHPGKHRHRPGRPLCLVAGYRVLGIAYGKSASCRPGPSPRADPDRHSWPASGSPKRRESAGAACSSYSSTPNSAIFC